MDLAPSRVSISKFSGDFRDPIDPDHFEASRDAATYLASIQVLQMGDLQLPFNDAVKKLEGLVGFNLKPDEQRALKELHIGSDLCLGASLGTR